MGRPPPYIRAMPKRKRFFLIDVFPNVDVDSDDDDELSVAMVSMSAHTWSESHHSGLFLSSSRLKDLINLDVWWNYVNSDDDGKLMNPPE